MIDPKNQRVAAEILRAEIQQLKVKARTDALFGIGSTLWLRIRDLEKIAQLLEDGLSETP
jgi:hypothetical protein